VRFKIFPLDLVSMIGPNGGGKTTLFRLLLGLVKPTRGKIRIFGHPPERVRHRVGYVPQSVSFDSRFPITVDDVVSMGRLRNRPTGPYRSEDRKAALEALREVELDGIKGRSFADLSGGQRQGVLIARALASDPEILLLDEPTANLDRSAEARVYELLKKLNRRLTILMASHDVGFVTRFVEKCLCVNRSAILHPTSHIDGGIIRELYGSEMAVVQHDHEIEPRGRPGGGVPEEDPDA
jgi:zinc transport system ATP-binding protein